MPRPMRHLQRAETESALRDAAWRRFAAIGPSGTSLREIAGEAGCNHSLVGRYFGSKDGLVAEVARRLAHGVDAAAETALTSGSDPVGEMLRAARTDRACVQLLVRSGLGDLGGDGCPAAGHAAQVLAPAPAASAAGPHSETRTSLCAYGAASLLLGWLTYDRFVTAAVRLRAASDHERDLAVAAAAHRLMAVARTPGPSLTGALHINRSLAPPQEEPPWSAARALVASAVELFALRGPASVSVRDVARHAGVNQGLIYRHFGSKQALLAAAFELGSSDLFPAALAPEGFDIDTVIHQVHHGSRAPWLIARIQVDDIDLAGVREQFPILRRLLDAYRDVPSSSGSLSPADPRVAVAAVTCMAMGSAVYGHDLRGALGLPDDGSAEVAVAALCRLLLAEPLEPGPSDYGWR